MMEYIKKYEQPVQDTHDSLRNNLNFELPDFAYTERKTFRRSYACSSDDEIEESRGFVPDTEFLFLSNKGSNFFAVDDPLDFSASSLHSVDDEPVNWADRLCADPYSAYAVSISPNLERFLFSNDFSSLTTSSTFTLPVYHHCQTSCYLESDQDSDLIDIDENYSYSNGGFETIQSFRGMQDSATSSSYNVTNGTPSQYYNSIGTLEQAAAAATASLIPLESDLTDEEPFPYVPDNSNSLSLWLRFQKKETAIPVSKYSQKHEDSKESTCLPNEYNHVIHERPMNNVQQASVSRRQSCNLNESREFLNGTSAFSNPWTAMNEQNESKNETGHEGSTEFRFFSDLNHLAVEKKRRYRGGDSSLVDVAYLKKQASSARGRGRGRSRGRPTFVGRECTGITWSQNNADANGNSVGDAITELASAPAIPKPLLNEQITDRSQYSTTSMINNTFEPASNASPKHDTNEGQNFLNTFSPPRYPGVCFSAAKDVWRARITLNRRQYESQFSVKKFGFQEAMWQAVAWRTSKEALYNAALERGQTFDVAAELADTT